MYTACPAAGVARRSPTGTLPRRRPGRLRFVMARAETLATEKLVPAAEVLGRRVADVAGAEVMWLALVLLAVAFLWDAAPTIHSMPPPTWARLEAWNR